MAPDNTSGWGYIPSWASGYVKTSGNAFTPTQEEQVIVYEYLIVYTGDDEWKGAKVLVGPTISLAAAEEVVRMEAARAIPEEYANKLDDVEIFVREWRQ